VNDEDTRHAYKSRDDAYRVFRRLLESSKLPDDWAALLAEARAEGDKLREFAAGLIR
jgi:toxin YhaV